MIVKVEDLLYRSHLFAKKAHKLEVRKYTGEPYITHPAMVASIVSAYGGSKLMEAAAWMHDVVEHGHATVEYLRTYFGEELATMVDYLTEVKDPSKPRYERKAEYAKRLSAAGHEVATVKLADIMANTLGISRHYPKDKFVLTYLKEKKLEVESLTSGEMILYFDTANTIAREIRMIEE